MRPTEKAEVDQLRKARAVERAIQSTSLIKGDRGDEFPTIEAKASYGEESRTESYISIYKLQHGLSK